MNSKLKVGLIVGGFFLAVALTLFHLYDARRVRCAEWIAATTPTDAEMGMIYADCSEYSAAAPDQTLRSLAYTNCVEDEKTRVITERPEWKRDPTHYGLSTDASAQCELFD